MNSKYFIAPLMLVFAACGHKQVNLTGDTTKIKFDSSSVDRDSTAAMKNKPVELAYLIIPGKSVGHTKLNSDLDTVFKRLGNSDRGDAAMGASVNTWYAKHDTSGYQTDVYAHRNYDGKHDAISYVKIIRVTSPAFQTANHVRVGETLENLSKQFNLARVAVYTKGTDSLKIYDDKQGGISFDINNKNRCKGIVVHAPGDDQMSYLSLYPDRERVDIKK